MFTITDDHETMKILGVSELRHLICHTNLGELTLMLRKGENQYTFVLDAVPVGTEQNKELTALFFTPKMANIPQVQKDSQITVSQVVVPQKSIDTLRKAVKGKQIKPVIKKK